MSWSLTGVKGLTDKVTKGCKEGQYFPFFFFRVFWQFIEKATTVYQTALVCISFTLTLNKP